LLNVLRREPACFDFVRSRWTLAMVLRACPWLRITTTGSLCRLLKRLGITYKRGRDYVHSPDPDYQAKQAAIAAAWREVQADPAHKVLLFLDELTVYRQPSLANAYAAKGRDQPLARRSLRSDTVTRILAVVNAATGQVTCIRRKTINVSCFRQFWAQIVAAYPGKEIRIVLDNWPMHYHPDVLAPLVPQTTRFAFPYSRSWKTLVEQSQGRPHTGRLPIQLLPLPTYASWLNLIEKVWRKLKQERIHLHRKADQWEQLQAAVDAFLDQYAQDSPELLRYIGLATPEHSLLYRSN
jgi:hypothetical protein